MLLHARLLSAFWVEVMYVRNQAMTTTAEVKPHERLQGKKTYVYDLFVFCCNACAHIPDASR